MPNPLFKEVQDRYDRDKTLASVRAMRVFWAQQDPELAEACTQLARRFTMRARVDCPAPSVEMGEALLFASSMFAGLLVEALREFDGTVAAPILLNLMAMAAEELIREGGHG